MGRKKATVATKSRIMKLASETRDYQVDEVTQEWLENEPKLNANSVNLFEDLCDATKQGDLEKTESLVRNFGAPINMVDSWQCNPLYYACLCGHYEVVKFLLQNGAQCDPNTFTGERCLYGALNDKVYTVFLLLRMAFDHSSSLYYDKIRRLLRSYKFSTAINENQPYLQFLTTLYESSTYSDFKFLIRRSADDTDYEEFSVHRFVLAARSTYFNDQFLGRWRDEKQVKLSHKLVDPTAFGAVLKFLYTGQVDDITNVALKNMIFVCTHLELAELQEQCESMLEADGEEEKNANRAQDAKAMARIRGDYEVFLQTILGCTYFATKNSQGEYVTGEPWVEDVSKTVSPSAAFADIGIFVEDAVFLCHRAMLCRSEFFKNMLLGDFAEADTSTTTIRYKDQVVELPLIELHDIMPESFQYVLEYLYTDRCTIPLELAYDVLLASDLMMLERLKSITAITLTSAEEPIMDIYELIRTAIRMNVDRLEQWCIKYFADHLDDFISRPEFQDLIHESAHSITGREETDSIPLIDDLRYCLSKKYCIFEGDLNPEGKVNEEYDLTELEALYNEKLDMLDRLLESLGLEA